MEGGLGPVEPNPGLLGASTSPVPQVSHRLQHPVRGDEHVSLADHHEVVLHDHGVVVGEVPQPQGLGDAGAEILRAHRHRHHGGSQSGQTQGLNIELISPPPKSGNKPVQISMICPRALVCHTHNHPASKPSSSDTTAQKNGEDGEEFSRTKPNLMDSLSQNNV